MTPEPPTLFDPRTTEMPKCAYCGTTAKNACLYSADLEHGTLPAGKRPRTCLNSAQLTADQPLPF